MRNRFDHLAKQIGREALGRSGVTAVHDEISPETQHADLRHEPDPAREAERRRLGLLGQLAAVLCLIEVYGHAPSADEFRACLGKHLAFWRQQARKARADHRKRGRRGRRSVVLEPFLWIVTAGAPNRLLTRLSLERAPGWPAGVYFFGDEILRVGIVVASELPRERSTLLVRLMAAGPLLAPAIAELGALPPDAPERAVAEGILLRLQHQLRQKPVRTHKEQEFIVKMLKTWEEGKDEARAEGLAEGRVETQADAVLTVLRVRGVPVPVAVRKRILAEKDLRQLKSWLAKAVVARSIEDVIGTPSRRRRAPAASTARARAR